VPPVGGCRVDTESNLTASSEEERSAAHFNHDGFLLMVTWIIKYGVKVHYVIVDYRFPAKAGEKKNGSTTANNYTRS
jgi:hypothetical protein